MAKRFTKSSIDWVALEKRVPLDQKTNFMAFKTRSDGYLRRQVFDVIADYNGTPTTICNKINKKISLFIFFNIN